MLELDSVGVETWTPDETFRHILASFNAAVRGHIDLMEPYITLLGGTDDKGEQVEIMRRALRETISVRFPLPSSRK